eukprot:TRINITY_DN9257_c0_g1_i1.p1 TRINITY_DN9257_c0_g1~~TRINITY_DN9257_c0_g1_i1.p1  ORF type:complete len:247 (+),score=67.70 TRINITY_DN9257_c0_g1_i1:110-850(+)
MCIRDSPTPSSRGKKRLRASGPGALSPTETGHNAAESTPTVLTDATEAHTGRAERRVLKGWVPPSQEAEDRRMDNQMMKMMREQESANPPAPDYMEHHQHLSVLMRCVLMDWMMEVCREFEMQRESFHLSVRVLDRFLSCVSKVPPSQLQLLGVAAMLLSAKMEEIYPPKVQELSVITDGAFSTQELKNMEKCILEQLDWDICLATPFRWAVLFLKRLPALWFATKDLEHTPVSYTHLTLPTKRIV